MEGPTLHDNLEARLGFDARLLYGLLAPAAVVVLLIAALAFSPTWWLLAPLALVLVGLTGIVVAGTLQMLDEDE